jgi:hypothetical protein
MFFYYRICSLTTEYVLLLQNVFSYYRMCSLTIECVLLLYQYFVLLGATSAMGPFNLLTQLGAHIIAVDLDRAPIWKRYA